MTSVPGSWIRMPLGDALELLIDHRGQTPGKLGGSFSNAGVPVVSAIHIKKGRVDFEQRRRFVTAELAERWMPQRLRKGDVLLTSEAPLGSVALVPTDEPIVLSQRLFALRGREGTLENRFLYWALQAPQIADQLRARSSGSTVTGIRQSELRQVTIRFPHVAEQRRIVDILEDHLSRLDAADAYLDAASRRIGQLVRAEERTLIAASDAGRASFDEVFRPVSDEGRRVAQKDYLAEGPVPVVDQGEGLVGGFTSVGLAFDGELPVIVFGDHTRRAKYVDFRFAVGAQGVKLLRAMPGVLPRFAYYLVRGANLRSRGYGRHYAMLRASSFALPPPERQAEVVAELDSMVETTDSLEQHVSLLRRRNSALRRALLASAFSGRLTGRSSDLDLAEEMASA